MTTTNAANNRDLALRFVEAFDSRDLQAIDHLLADDFVWHVAVVPEGVTQFRPFQSEELQGRKHTHTSRPARQTCDCGLLRKALSRSMMCSWPNSPQVPRGFGGLRSNFSLAAPIRTKDDRTTSDRAW